MSYTIHHYDSSNTTPVTIINDKKIDNLTTTLTFNGLNSVDFGLGLNENYLHLMEHFCDKDITIAKLVPGQLWFDNTIKKMKIWTGSKWHILKELTTNITPKGFVTIVGNIVSGSTVSTANTLTDEDGLGDFSYQWYLDAVPIPNATDSTYTIQLSDVNHTLAVSLSYIDGNHNKETVYSKEYPINIAANNLPTGSVTIDGIIQIGETVTAINNGISDADGFLGIQFGWLLDGVDIVGENNPTYVIKVGDAGKTLKAKIYFTDNLGNNESVLSNGVIIPYAVTTTTIGSTTTSTTLPVVLPNTSALQASISQCNASVPLLKTAWASSVSDYETAAGRYMAVSTSAYELFDDAVDAAYYPYYDAFENITSKLNVWKTGINSCIQNKQNLFNILKDESSAQSLAAAYNEKLNAYKTAIELAYTFRTTASTTYMSGIMSAAQFNDWYIFTNGLNEVAIDSRVPINNYLTDFVTTYNAALLANQNILNEVKTQASVTRISDLCDLNISCWDSFKTKESDFYTLADTKLQGTNGISPVGDGNFKIQYIEEVQEYANTKKNDAIAKYNTAITSKVTIMAAANTVLNS